MKKGLIFGVLTFTLSTLAMANEGHDEGGASGGGVRARRASSSDGRTCLSVENGYTLTFPQSVKLGGKKKQRPSSFLKGGQVLDTRPDTPYCVATKVAGNMQVREIPAGTLTNRPGNKVLARYTAHPGKKKGSFIKGCRITVQTGQEVFDVDCFVAGRGEATLGDVTQGLSGFATLSIK